jgi:hypothetical protein
MHEALNSRRAVLKDLGARKVEKATRAQLLGERERKGSGGAGSLPSWGEMKGAEEEERFVLQRWVSSWRRFRESAPFTRR